MLHTSHLTPHTSHLTPQTSHPTPHTTHVTREQAFLCDFNHALSHIPAAASSCAHVDMQSLCQHLCGGSVTGIMQQLTCSSAWRII
jgi:hypothetical protein